MLIVQMVLKYMLTHRYSEENELLLETAYFDIWGKNEKCKQLVEWWKEGYFDNLELISVEYIEDKLGDLYHEQDIWDDDRLNLEEIDTLERLVDGWRKSRR